MTPSILGLTFNDLTSLYRAKPEINTSKSETDPVISGGREKGLQRGIFCAMLLPGSNDERRTPQERRFYLYPPEPAGKGESWAYTESAASLCQRGGHRFLDAAGGSQPSFVDTPHAGRYRATVLKRQSISD